MKLLIKNGTLINPAGKSGELDILVENKKIVKIAEKIEEKDARVIDAKGLFVFPGLIDMHVHLREPGQEWKEDILSGTRAAVHGGFTAVSCMPNTDPVIDNASTVQYVLDKAKEAGYAKVYPMGAVSKGLKGEELAEMGDMIQAGAVAFTDDGRPVSNSNLMRHGMEYAKNFNTFISSHCEDLDMVNGGVMNDGYMSTILGLPGNIRNAEENHISREILLANSLNTHVHIAHVSTAGGVEMIRHAKVMGIKVTAETAPHYFTATDEWVKGYNTNAKVNPPLRAESDRQAIIEGLQDGTLDCIITDHAPHHVDDKKVEFNNAAYGISGLETSLALTNSILVKNNLITVEDMVTLMSVNPAKILGVEGGVLTEGKTADITIADLNKKWTVDTDEFESKGKNSLYINMELQGKAAYTIVDGKVLLDNYKMQ